MSTAKKAKDTMKTLDAKKIARPAPKNRQEHSVPWFWPLAAGIELGEEGFRRIFFYDLSREPPQYLIGSHFTFHL